MTFLKLAATACMAGALALGSGAALAGVQPDVGVAGADGAAAPGATAYTSLTISFAQAYNFVGVDLEGFYDTSRLTFNAGLSSVSLPGGAPSSLPDFMAQLALLQVTTGGDFTVTAGVTDSGDMSLHAGYVDGVSSYLLPMGNLVVTMAFDLKPSMVVGSTANVTFTQLAVADVNEMTPLAWDENRFVLSVTAVPEPESWLMMLAGVGLLGALARRRSASV